MALNATSTLAAIYEQYVANQLYAVHGSRAEAEAFAEACQWILLKPVETEDRDGSAKFDRSAVEAELRAVRNWLGQFTTTPAAATTTNPSVTKASFTNFRD